jgi:Helix-turn-helix domain
MTADITPQYEYAEWLDLKNLSLYACASEQTLRKWIHSPTNPLPASQRGNKIYVRKRDFDEWMRRHTIQDKSGVRLHQMVDEIINEVTKSHTR